MPRDHPGDDGQLETCFAPGRRILSGFDAPAPTGEWQVGDRILFGLRIDQGDEGLVRFILLELKSGVLPPDTDVIIGPAGAAPAADDPSIKTVYVPLSDGDAVELRGRLPGRRWSVWTTFTDKAGKEHRITRDSDPVFLAVHVYDDDARKIKSAGTLAPEAYLRRGLYAACVAAMERATQHHDDRAGAPVEFADVLPLLYGFGQTIADTPNLTEIIKALVPMPSLWSLLVRGGRIDCSARVGLGEVTNEDRPLAAIIHARGAYRFPIDIEVNAEPSLRCLLSVVTPAPPFHLCAGIVGLDGVQAKDASHRFALRLLAARRSD